MRSRTATVLRMLAALAAILAAPGLLGAHPLGNFSISHYASLRVERDRIVVRYLIDMAEIPTFQEIQQTDIVPEAGHASLPAYLARRAASLKEGLRLELDGRRLDLGVEASEVIFPPGAGGLPTLKLGVLYRATLDTGPGRSPRELSYRDENFPDRAGWKEVVAAAGSGITLVQSSAPDRDRSQELRDYPATLIDSPPQDVEARVVFVAGPSVAPVVRSGPPGRPRDPAPAAPVPAATRSAQPTPAAGSPRSDTRAPALDVGLRPNRPTTTPRDAFTELIASRQLGFGVILFAMAVAASLGAFHALEPGHGKTVVAAYLVGARGTAYHALLLGLIVTASHTAGVYLLGAVTLYASRYVLPEHLYPWLGVLSGLTIAGLGVGLFVRRYAATHGHGHRHADDHQHEQDHHHDHHEDHGHDHDHPRHGDHGQSQGRRGHHHHVPDGPVTLRALIALGVTGGIVPCPAALVVLLSAIALRRVGFGLLLIVAFSVGLAAVLIGIGLLMVYARRFMSRFRGEGSVMTRWLPLTSAAVIALTGVVIATQALVTAGILVVRL